MAVVIAVVIALLWLIVDQVLRGYLPLRWGGPNIGGGFLVGICYVALLVGVVRLALDRGLWTRRWSGWMWTSGAVIVVLFAGFLFVRIVQPRDTDAGLVGRVGVTVTARGEPVLALLVCRGSIDRVEIVGPHRGSVPNEHLATYRSDAPVSGYQEMSLSDPGPGWLADPGITGDGIAGQALVIASADGEKAALASVSFTAADLAGLSPGVVQDGSGPGTQRRSVDDFRAVVCR